VADSIEDRLGASILDSEGVPPEVQDQPFEPEVDDEAIEATADEPEADRDSEGVDAADEGGEDDVLGATEEGIVEIEMDGQVYEVPESLKDSFLKNADYTQKTQELSAQRETVQALQKQVEVQQKEQQFISDIQPDLNNIGYLQAQIQQMENDLQTNLQTLSSEQLFRKKIEMDGFKEQMNALKGQLEIKYKEFEDAQKQSYEELLAQGAQVLKESIPDWSEDKQKSVRDYAVAQGFSEQEVSSIIDPRHVKILYAAQQYEALKGKATPVAEKTAKVIKARARTPKQTANDKKMAMKNKLRGKNLSAKDKAKLIEQELGARFG
jgi:hypothetical protein